MHGFCCSPNKDEDHDASDDAQGWEPLVAGVQPVTQPAEDYAGPVSLEQLLELSERPAAFHRTTLTVSACEHPRIQHHFLGDASCVGPTKLGLLTSLQQLTMDFGGCTHLFDLSVLGRGLAQLHALVELSLNFEDCKQLSDTSPIGVGVGQLLSLKTLTVSLSGCWRVTDAGVLGEQLQRTQLQPLDQISIEMVECSQLTDLSSLARGFKGLNCVSHLGINLSKSGKLCDIEPLVQELTQLQSLKHLVLNFSACIELRGFGTLGHAIAQLLCLEHLSLDFSRCWNVVDLDRLGTAVGVLLQLRVLSVDCSRCWQLQNIEPLCQSLTQLHSLVELRLDLSGCLQLTDLSSLDAVLMGNCKLHSEIMRPAGGKGADHALRRAQQQQNHTVLTPIAGDSAATIQAASGGKEGATKVKVLQPKGTASADCRARQAAGDPETMTTADTSDNHIMTQESAALLGTVEDD